MLAAILPEVTSLERLDRLIAAGAPADPMLRLAALSPAADLAERWRLSMDERIELVDLAGLAPDPALSGADLRRALADTPADVLIARSWLTQGAAGHALRASIAAEPKLNFALAGRDALALGVPPGPEVGTLIRDVRSWWLAGGCVASAADCRDELARRVASGRARL